MGNGLLLSAFVVAAMALTSSVAPAEAAGLGFEFHHRFSDRVRQWSEERDIPGTWWPEKGTAEYYAALAHHDLDQARRRGRLLADDNGLGTFVDGNETYRLSSLGYLHYAVVAVGTPNVTFLVALDTGSDLFWVPCDCIKCAPPSSPNYPGLKFDYYSPSNSSTSKKILCGDSSCEVGTSCPGVNSSCPYSVLYADNSSTAGVLVEDVLYLSTQGSGPKAVQVPITFGCGEILTGSFLDTGAPNGLFGLGRKKISVPSILASKGIFSDSFSMCFGEDGVGRINFGDKGSSDQMETPLLLNLTRSHYMIGITSAEVGKSTIATSFTAIVDTGTSFTLLDDPIYTSLTKSFNSQVKEKRHISDGLDIPFEFCYDLSPTQTSILLPRIKLIANGGSVIAINDPIILLGTQSQNIYCLAVIKSNMNILAQNFLTGFLVVFDREKNIIGWKDFDCYKTESTDNLIINNTAPAASPGSFNSPDQGDTSTVIPVGSGRVSLGTSLSVPSVLLLIVLAFPLFYL